MDVVVICDEDRTRIFLGKRVTDGRKIPSFWLASMNESQVAAKLAGYIADRVGKTIRVLDDCGQDEHLEVHTYERVDHLYGDDQFKRLDGAVE